MKIPSSICIVILLFCGIGAGAQTTFTAYDRSSATAKAAWDQYYKNGTAPDAAAFDTKNPFDCSLKLLVAASRHIDADSTIKCVVASVLACRDQLDTLPFAIPVELQKKLSVNCSEGREQLLDGLMQLYYLAPWQCIYFIKEKRQILQEKNSEPFLAFTFLNEALLYSEVLGKPERALPLIDSAIVIWTKLGDHSQLANNIKARGIVFLRMKKFREAEKEIKSGMALFKKNDVKSGVLSCQLDLVLLFAQSGEPDSMKKYDQLCRPEFEAMDTIRLFVLNTNRLAAYQTANQYSIRDFAQQNAELLSSSKFHPAMVIDYYRYSIKAFTFFGESVLLKNYRLKYDNLQKELLKQGYWPGLFK